jgi:hypothetical protein
LAGSTCGLTEALSQHLPGWTKEKDKKPVKMLKPKFQLRFKLIPLLGASVSHCGNAFVKSHYSENKIRSIMLEVLPYIYTIMLME